MSTRTFALISVLSLITIVLVMLAISPKNKLSQQAQPAPSMVVNAQSTLTLSPNPIRMSSPSGTVDVMIDTKDNNVTTTQLELAYDPSFITSVEVTPGTFFDSPNVLLKEIKQAEGRITYAIGIPPAGNGRKGTGVIATIKFQAIGRAGTSTNISFLPKTVVTAEGIAPSVLKSALGTTVLFGSAQTTIPAQGTPSGNQQTILVQPR